MAGIRKNRKERLHEQIDRRQKILANIKARYAQRRQKIRLDPNLTKSQKMKIRESADSTESGGRFRFKVGAHSDAMAGGDSAHGGGRFVNRSAAMPEPPYVMSSRPTK